MTKQEKQNQNAKILAYFAEKRKQDPRGYGLFLLKCAYLEVRDYATSKACRRDELRFMASQLSERIKEVAQRYSLSIEEIRGFFAKNNFVLSF